MPSRYSWAMARTIPATSDPRRGRGTRAGLTTARIIEAARELEPQGLTVQAVADRLGVDRAAVHHHVADIDTLRELVAFDAFTVRLSPVTIPADTGWREACRLLALSMHDAMLAAGGLVTYLQLTLAEVTVLEPVEHTLRSMMDAGFDDETAARSLTALSSLAMAVARERLLGTRQNGHPQVPALREALKQDPAREFAILRRLADADLVSFDDTQLHTSIDLILDGMAVRLARIEEMSKPRK